MYIKLGEVLSFINTSKITITAKKNKLPYVLKLFYFLNEILCPKFIVEKLVKFKLHEIKTLIGQK